MTGHTAGTDTADTAFADRLARVRQRIETACATVGRSPRSVMLLGVTKTHPPELARRAVAHHLDDLGESRVQELCAKLPHVPGARWHLIGPLQRNKVGDIVGRAVLVHTLDRRPLADALSRRAALTGNVQRVLVQVNVGADPAKAGCAYEEALDLVAYARELPHLAVEGLMTMPPAPDDVATANDAARPHFARLRSLRDAARSRWPEVVHLSMGMTADLEAAVHEGATIVRVGSALFGDRGPRPWQPT